ncbi:carbohydrate-binding protein [Streptomyces sp. NPDC051976]|uniref:carbohydrate-binding protein n=1 Tax=Streptomyces sp. NPDC051976 TaxID=3154947 RepID=UPI003416565C
MTPHLNETEGLDRRRFLQAVGGATLAGALGGPLLNVLNAAPADAAAWGPGNPLFDARWGTFIQFLPNPGDTLATWSARVDAFDVDAHAAQVATANVGFVLLMLRQGPDYTCSPNPSWPSSTRDLPNDLYTALNAKGIKLVLYHPADKSQSLVINALTAYSQRYGTKVSGWYLDGAGGASPSYLDQLASAVKAGNPSTQIMFNGGGGGHGETISQFEGYDLLRSVHTQYPRGGNVNGEQAGVTSYMSQWYGRDGWEPNYPVPEQNQAGPRYATAQIVKAVTDYVGAGGLVNLDVPVDPNNGKILSGYIPQLNTLGAAIAQVTNRNSPARIDDVLDDRAPGTVYSGSWTTYAGTLPLSNYGTTEQRSSTAGDTATYTFYGNAINLIGRVWNNMGKADVAIDGIWDATIDFYSAREYYQQVVYSRAGLALGNHTLTVTVRTDRSPSSTGNLIAVDAFEPASDRIEGESMCLFGGAKAQTSANASRGMDVGYMTATGAGLEYPSPAKATSLTLSYSTTSSGTFSLYVNGVKRASVPVASTGSYATYATVTVPVSISAGDTVTLQRDTSDVSINVDYVVDRLEGEYGTLLGGARVEAHSGASNGQNVGYMASTGDGVSFAGVDATTRLQIGYAAAVAGTFSLYVNGGKYQAVAFPATGGWNSFSTAVVKVPIPAGATVTLQHDAGDTPINVDYIKVTPSVRVAAYGTLLGGAQVEWHPNASHGLSVGYLTGIGDGVSLGNMSASGFLQIGYAAASAGTFSLYVNGVKNQAAAFPATGGWGSFATVTVAAAISAGATVTLQHDAGDTPINIDFIAQ